MEAFTKALQGAKEATKGITMVHHGAALWAGAIRDGMTAPLPVINEDGKAQWLYSEPTEDGDEPKERHLTSAGDFGSSANDMRLGATLAAAAIATDPDNAPATAKQWQQHGKAMGLTSVNDFRAIGKAWTAANADGRTTDVAAITATYVAARTEAETEGKTPGKARKAATATAITDHGLTIKKGGGGRPTSAPASVTELAAALVEAFGAENDGEGATEAVKRAVDVNNAAMARNVGTVLVETADGIARALAEAERRAATATRARSAAA